MHMHSIVLKAISRSSASDEAFPWPSPAAVITKHCCATRNRLSQELKESFKKAGPSDKAKRHKSGGKNKKRGERRD